MAVTETNEGGPVMITRRLLLPSMRAACGVVILCPGPRLEKGASVNVCVVESPVCEKSSVRKEKSLS